MDQICPLAIPKQTSTMSIHTPSLVKIHWYLIKSSSRNENLIRTCRWQITLSKIIEICPSTIPNQISTIWIRATNVVKINPYLLKISIGSENKDLPRQAILSKLTNFAHLQSKARSRQYQCTNRVWWNSINIYASYRPEAKIRTDRHTTDGRTGRHTGSQHDTIIPRPCRMAGYKHLEYKSKHWQHW